MTNSVPRGLEPVPLNVFISETDSVIECTLSKFSDHTKLSGAADMPQGSGCHPKGLGQTGEVGQGEFPEV